MTKASLICSDVSIEHSNCDADRHGPLQVSRQESVARIKTIVLQNSFLAWRNNKTTWVNGVPAVFPADRLLVKWWMSTRWSKDDRTVSRKVQVCNAELASKIKELHVDRGVPGFWWLGVHVSPPFPSPPFPLPFLSVPLSSAPLSSLT